MRRCQTWPRAAACLLLLSVTESVWSENVKLAQLPDNTSEDIFNRKNSRVLEEVLVVAQRKTESIQDVPISISVVDDQLIEDWSITDINTAVQFTPNVRIADAGFYIVPRIRGFGTNQSNKAFEPPAGVAIDGIPYTRLEYFTAALFDVQRVEVYRGPQGTAFGKNTTAGLIHLITRRPSDSWQGNLDLQHGERGRRRIELGVGGPLLNQLNVRLAGLYDERDGFVHNSATEQSLSGAAPLQRGTARRGARIRLEAPELWGSQLIATYEYMDIESIGAGLEMFWPSDAQRETITRYDSNTDFERGNYRGTVNDPDFRQFRIDTWTLDWSMKIGNWDAFVLGGYSVLKGNNAVDLDASPAPAVATTDDDDSPTTTFELRFQSPPLDGLFGLEQLFGRDLGDSDLLAGVYYQERRIQGDGFTFEIGEPYLELIAAGASSAQAETLSPELAALLADTLGSAPAPGQTLDRLYSEEVTKEFFQDADARAVFVQTSWNWTPHWGVEYGLRYNTEDKRAIFAQYYSSPEPNPILTALDAEQYSGDLSRNENNVSQRLSLNWEPNDDIGVYLHWATGFRSGGYNAFSFRDGDHEYGPESAVDWGLDFKSKMLDGSMRLNLSLFRLEIDDFQVLTSFSADRPAYSGPS